MTLPNGQRVIAFDFDGVLHEYHGWNGGKLLGPIPGMRETVALLFRAGAHVVIHTTRRKEDVQPWLAEHRFPPLDVLNEKWSRIDVFVDDRAIGFDPAVVKGEEEIQPFVKWLLRFQPHWRGDGGGRR